MNAFRRLCTRCVDALGILRPSYTDPLATTGQRDSHAKHSRPSTGYDKQGVFDSDSTAYWRDTLNETLALGFLEIDYYGRPRFVRVPSTGSRIGGVFSQGSEVYEADSIIATNPWTSTGAKCFPDGSSRWTRLTCDRCGGQLS